MRAWWILAQISTIIFDVCLAGRCWPSPCVIEPKVLRFWYHTMEIDALSINVYEGDDISLTCDGSCVGLNYEPYLRWYGPDRIWISSEQQSDRVHVEREWFNQYQKLHIQSVQSSDAGPYFCRGKLGSKVGWRIKSIILHVVSKETNSDNSSSDRESNSIQSVTIRSTQKQYKQSITAVYQGSPYARKSSTLKDITKYVPTITSTIKTTEQTSTSTTPSTITTDSTQQTTTEADISTDPGCTWPQAFRCNNGDCIDRDLHCDSIPDCAFGEDEDNCYLSCSESEIACDDNSGCYSRFEACDGKKQCFDGSDEFTFRCY